MQDVGCKPRVRVFQWPGSVFGARCSALGADPVSGIRSQVPGTRHRSRSNTEGRIPGTEPGVPGTGFGVRPSVLGLRLGRSMREGRISLAPYPSMAEGRIPNTEDRVGNAHTGFASYILHPVSCILHTPCAGFSKTGGWCQVPGPGHLAPGTRDRINAEGRIPSTEDRVGRPGTGKRAHRVCILYPASHLQGGTHRPSPNRVKASVSKVRRCRKIMTNRASPTAASEAARTMTIEAMTCPSTEP